MSSYKEANKENQELNKENHDNNNINEVINAFKYFDTKKNGKVDIKDLNYSLTHLGNKMTEDEINNIFKKANVDLKTYNNNNNNDLDYIQLINFFNSNK